MAGVSPRRRARGGPATRARRTESARGGAFGAPLLDDSRLAFGRCGFGAFGGRLRRGGARGVELAQLRFGAVAARIRLLDERVGFLERGARVAELLFGVGSSLLGCLGASQIARRLGLFERERFERQFPMRLIAGEARAVGTREGLVRLG